MGVCHCRCQVDDCMLCVWLCVRCRVLSFVNLRVGDFQMLCF